MCRWILFFDGVASIFFNLVSSLMAFSYIFHRAGEEGRQRVWVQTKSGRCCWVRIGGSAGVGSSGESSSSLGRDPVAPEQHATCDTAQHSSRAQQHSTALPGDTKVAALGTQCFNQWKGRLIVGHHNDDKTSQVRLYQGKTKLDFLFVPLFDRSRCPWPQSAEKGSDRVGAGCRDPARHQLGQRNIWVN